MQNSIIKESILFGWKVTKQHFWFFIGLMLILGIVFFIFSFFSELVEDDTFVFILLTTVSVIVNMILSMGLLFISLKLHDEKPVAYDDLLTPAHLFPRFLGASVLYFLIVGAGFILLIVPGIIWAIKYRFYRFLIIEHRMGAIEALKKSAKITAGSKWTIFWFSISISILNILGILALFVGIFVTIPISIMAYAHLYRHLLAKTESQAITIPPSEQLA